MKRIFALVLVFASLLGIEKTMAQLPTAAPDISPLLIGETVPDAQLVNTKGQTLSFYSLLQEKPTIVIFYRGDWCFNCINHFKEEIVPHLADIQKLGYNLVSISPDSPENLIKSSGQTGIDQSTFFQDGDGTLSIGMGLAWQQGDRLMQMIKQSSGGKNTIGFLPVPAVYVIGIDQKVLFEYINPNGPQSSLRMKGDLLMAVLKTLK